MLSLYENPAFVSSENTGIMFPMSPPRSNQNQNQATDGYTSPPSVNFSSAPMMAHNDCDSGSVPPPLWPPESSGYVPNSSYHNPMALPAQEIEGGRRELVKLYDDMPESAYELSFKHLVDHNAAMEQMLSDDSPTWKETDNSLENKRASGEYIRRKDDDPKCFLWNMFAPSNLMAGSRSPSPSRVVRQNNNQSSGNSPKKVVRKERPNNRLLSLFRIRPSQNPEMSPSNRASKVSPRPYMGTDGQPDLPFMGSPNRPKSKSSNQCVMCSAYTIFFKTQCQACDKIYCSNCVKLAIVNTRKGPRCQATCALGSNSERDLKPKKNSCWPSLSSIKIKSVRKTILL